MCDNFRDNEWKPLPKLNDDEKEILKKALVAATSHYVRQELDAETEDDRDYYLNQEKEVNALFVKVFGPAPTEPKPQKKKKFRPFETMEEFVKTIGDIGIIITYRTKKEPSQEMRGMFTGYMWDSACRGWILGIGASLYRLENLFELLEYKYKNEWKPFGVYE